MATMRSRKSGAQSPDTRSSTFALGWGAGGATVPLAVGTGVALVLPLGAGASSSEGSRSSALGFGSALPGTSVPTVHAEVAPTESTPSTNTKEWRSRIFPTYGAGGRIFLSEERTRISEGWSGVRYGAASPRSSTVTVYGATSVRTSAADFVAPPERSVRPVREALR